MHRFTVDLDDDLYAALITAANNERRTMAAVVRHVLGAYLFPPEYQRDEDDLEWHKV